MTLSETGNKGKSISENFVFVQLGVSLRDLVDGVLHIKYSGMERKLTWREGDR